MYGFTCIALVSLMCFFVGGSAGSLSEHLHIEGEEDILFLSTVELEDSRQEVLRMFQHAYRGYMTHAFPKDELLPLSCKGQDTLGGYSLTRVDAMDSLALLGMQKEFEEAVRWAATLNFDLDMDVSVFETNIRVVGGLLSSHLLALHPNTRVEWYTDELLHGAVDLVDRLMPAFSTPSGIPIRMVNLRHGLVQAPENPEMGCPAQGRPIPKNDRISTAEVGTYLLEFGVLSNLTGNPVYKETALKAMKYVYDIRLPGDVLGTELDPATGQWLRNGMAKWIGIGSGVDSFYEYLMKGWLLFGDVELLDMFDTLYSGIYKHFKQDMWYIRVDIEDYSVVDPIFMNLDAYWPGVQVLRGKDIEDAAETLSAYHSVWQMNELLPEKFDIHKGVPYSADRRYQLRPELAESMFYLHNHTAHPIWPLLGRDIVDSIQKYCKTRCGYASVDLQMGQITKLDKMESFFLSETTKYLYLLYTPQHPLMVHPGLVFSTEGHPLWLPSNAELAE